MAVTHNQVETLFDHLRTGHSERFFAKVAPDVRWLVMGTHPLAGEYLSKEDFLAHTFHRLNKLLRNGVILNVQNIIVQGDMAAVEMVSTSIANNGMNFNNQYCWIVRFKNDKIVEVRAYLDSALVQKLIDENEKH